MEAHPPAIIASDPDTAPPAEPAVVRYDPQVVAQALTRDVAKVADRINTIRMQLEDPYLELDLGAIRADVDAASTRLTDAAKALADLTKEA